MIRPATDADMPGIPSIWNPVIRETAMAFDPMEMSPGEIAQMQAAKAAPGFANTRDCPRRAGNPGAGSTRS